MRSTGPCTTESGRTAWPHGSAGAGPRVRYSQSSVWCWRARCSPPPRPVNSRRSTHWLATPPRSSKGRTCIAASVRCATASTPRATVAATSPPATGCTAESDAQIAKTIAEGVPGTEMPAHRDLSDDEVWMLIAYLRTLSAPGGPAVEHGDASRGEQLFWASTGANCGRCHMVERSRRPARSSADAHRRLPLGGGARTRDPPSGRGHSRWIRDDHRHHARRQEDSRPAQERGHLLGAGDDARPRTCCRLPSRRRRSIPSRYGR